MQVYGLLPGESDSSMKMLLRVLGVVVVVGVDCGVSFGLTDWWI